MADAQGNRLPLRLIREIQLHTWARNAVASFRLRESLQAAREIVRCVAVEHGHVLGSWRVEGADRHALIQCGQCGDGARLDLDTAVARMTDGLGRQCDGMVGR